MKITISHYEGQPEYASFSCEMPDDTNLYDFMEKLQSIVGCVFSGVEKLSWLDKRETA